MITTCTHCNARYRLDAGKVPRRVIRVRCPGCNGVFHLDGAADAPAPINEGMPEGFVNGFDSVSGSESLNAPVDTPVQEAKKDFAPPVQEAPVDSVPALDPEPVAPAAQLDTPVDPPKPAGRRRRSKEEMLARALVSDILVYNRDLRDKSIAEGNLAQAMSAEIKKSWELYKEKVTPEVATQSECFRDALNEILAEGEKVF